MSLDYVPAVVAYSSIYGATRGCDPPQITRYQVGIHLSLAKSHVTSGDDFISKIMISGVYPVFHLEGSRLLKHLYNCLV